MRFEYLDKRWSKYDNKHGQIRNLGYGDNCTSEDEDLKAVNPFTRKTEALLEFKFPAPTVKTIDLNTFQFDNKCDDAKQLQDGKGVPVLLVRPFIWKGDDTLLNADENHKALVHVQYQVIPVNGTAIKALGKKKVFNITERCYLGLVHRIRRAPPVNITAEIFDTLRPVQTPAIIWRPNE